MIIRKHKRQSKRQKAAKKKAIAQIKADATIFYPDRKRVVSGEVLPLIQHSAQCETPGQLE